MRPTPLATRLALRSWPLLLVALAACAGTRPATAPAGPARAPSTAAPEVETLPGYAYLTSDGAEREARALLAVLAADSLEGREAASAGERRAGALLARTLEAMGVEPGGDQASAGRRSYFQAFPVYTTGLDRARTGLTIDGLGEARLGEDWLTFPGAVPDADGALDIVFAGYGLVDAASGRNDYAGLDVAGKLVVVAGGHPAGLDSVAGPQGMVPADGFLAKFIPALQARAAAILVVAGPDVEESWGAYANQARGTGMALEASGQTAPIPFGFLRPAFAARLLAAMGAPGSVVEDARAGRAVAPIARGPGARLRLATVRGEGEARNVVGVLPGSGPDAEEFVAFGAHYDHLGVIDGEIFNGADDDASGTTAVVALARALAADRAAGRGPNRSAVFVFHTAEEKGLFGSDYFTANPAASAVGAIERVVAQVNLDMVGREHPDSLYVIGSDRLSTAYNETVVMANASLGENGRALFTLDRTFDAADHPENLYQRSDHYNYARFGVPIVFFTDGMGANEGKGGPADDYHEPGDDTAKIDFDKILDVTRLAYAIGRMTADADERPVVDRPVGGGATD